MKTIAEENKEEIITLLGAIAKAKAGDSKDLEDTIRALTSERDKFIQEVQLKVASINGQINLLQTLLNQTKVSSNGLD